MKKKNRPGFALANALVPRYFEQYPHIYDHILRSPFWIGPHKTQLSSSTLVRYHPEAKYKT